MENHGHKCPIPMTHARLHEAHRFWHEAEHSYQDPLEFTTKLNALIQAFRNVTFVMQSELAHEHSFPEWYSKQQTALRSVPYMNNLREARNIVVKRGDLEKKSLAKVDILTYEDNPVVSHEVSPSVSLSELAEFYRSSIHNPGKRFDFVLQVERSWIAAEISENEVLSVIRDGLHLLEDLVEDWHKECNAAFDECDKFFSPHVSSECTLNANSYRIIQSSLNDGGTYSIHTTLIHPDDKIMQKAVRRYGTSIQDIEKEAEGMPSRGNTAPWSAVNTIIGMAKTVLQRDGYHVPIFHLFKDGKSLTIIHVAPRERGEKYLLSRKVAEQVLELGADGLIFTTEIWMSPVAHDRSGQIIFPADAPDRQEALAVYVATSDMRAMLYKTPFTKNLLGKISYGETTEIPIDEDSFLLPIFKVWKGRGPVK